MLRGSGQMIQRARRRRQVLGAALQELVAYAFEETVRIKKKKSHFFFRAGARYKPSHIRGILQEAQSLLQKYRSELVRQSCLLDQEGRT